MLSTSVIEGTNIVTATYAGSLSTEQMEQLHDQLSEIVARDGSVRLLVELGDIAPGQIEPAAIWEDLKLAGMIDDLDRYAVVADQNWIGPLVGAVEVVTPFDLKAFSTDRRDDAVAWLSENRRPTE